MKEQDLHWLSGILEGEGSFIAGNPQRPARICISMQTTDEDIIQRVASLLESKYWICSEKRRKENPHWKIVYGTSKTGLKALCLMRLLKPLMGQRRQQQIHRAEESFEKNKKTGRYMTKELVLQIIEENKQGTETQGNIAKKYGLRRETINKICRGKLPKWVDLTNNMDCRSVV